MIPTVPGYVKGDQIIVRCPFCGKRHYHGYHADEIRAHRVSHCDSEESGYYIEIRGGQP